MVMSSSFHFHEIKELADPVLLPWLDLYETSFPLEERIPVSRFLRVLHDRAAGKPTGRQMLAVMQASENRLIAMMDLYLPDSAEAAFLWYFAVVPETRGQGLGSQVYRRLLVSLPPTVRALIFDLEDPAALPSPEQQTCASRRVGFYRRQGARLLGGIRYIQRVYPHQPPLPLRVMVQAIAPTTPEQAYQLAKPVLGEAITAIETLVWE